MKIYFIFIFFLTIIKFIQSSDQPSLTFLFSPNPIKVFHINKSIAQENKNRCAQFGIDYNDEEKLVGIFHCIDEDQQSQRLLQRILTNVNNENINTIIEEYNQIIFPWYLPNRLIVQKTIEILLPPSLYSLPITITFKEKKENDSIVQKNSIGAIPLLLYCSFFMPIIIFLIKEIK